jgi:hypothetical protein
VARPLLADTLALRDDPNQQIRLNVYDALRGMRVEIDRQVEATLLRGVEDDYIFTRMSAYLAAGTLRPVTPAIVAAMLRRYHTSPDESEPRDMRGQLTACIRALWDAGAVAM